MDMPATTNKGGGGPWPLLFYDSYPLPLKGLLT